MNLPNLITTARLVFTVLVFVCLEWAISSGGPRFTGPYTADGNVLVDTTLVWIAFALFMVAAVSDFVDGYLARRWQMVTAFGRVADPFADKVLIAGTLITLLQFKAAHQALTTWYVVIVVAREFLVTSIRALVEASGQPFPADRLGKWKMVSQCWTCAALLTMVAGSDFWVWAAILGFWVSLGLTLISGFNYVWKARGILFAGASGVSLLDRLRWCLITSFGLGLSPFAPGTVGTLGGVVLAVTLQWAFRPHYVLAWSIAAGVLFVYGCLETRFVERVWPKKDPGQFVLDEVVGYLVTVLVYALVREEPFGFAHMAAFFAFRAFDVLKIQPAKKLEDLPGAFGIMADDQMAGIYAGLSMWLVLPLIGQ